MPRRKWIDKNNATTYQLVHRPQNDPRIHDPSSSSMVFQELAPSQARKTRDRGDLESELFGDDASDGWSVRDNEGEAAEHGIYYDDTKYDYMQHMRDLGGATGSVWVEAPGEEKGKGKEKISLDEALKEMNIDSLEPRGEKSKAKITDESMLPSTNLRKANYQDQQEIPDALAGFQPDMDPRLREALEALEDDAYVDEDAKDDTFFTDIAEDGQEISLAEFEDLDYVPEGDFEDDGWSTDDTAKPDKEYNSGVPLSMDEKVPVIDSVPPDATTVPPEAGPDHGDGDFMASFRNMPKSVRKPAAPSQADGVPASIVTGQSALTAGGRKKKRKGALTNSDAYSMTSSSLFRTEGQTLLDARFDKTMETYMEEDEDMYADDDTASVATGQLSNVSGISKMSKASGVSRASTQPPDLVIRKDFDNIMDDFLGGYSMSGKKRVKKGKYQTGMQQLDEVRRELGRPTGKAVAAKAGAGS